MRRMITAVVAAIALVFTVSACTQEGSDTPKGQAAENQNRQSNYERLVEAQPAHSMEYSPTRATKNFWIDVWGEKGKLSYVYLLNNSGEAFGYFIFEGLPVSYCTSLIPPYQKTDLDVGEFGGETIVPGPSIDGTFSSSSNCSAFYGKDATSGAYMEYTVGQGINALIFDQPMSQFGAAEPLGDATPQTAK